VLALLELAPDLRLALDPTHFVARDVAQERIHPLVPHARHFHARGARSGLGQCAVKDNVVDYGRFVQELQASGYEGAIAIEYVWIEWERMNECDNVSETILMRDQLRALLAREHDEEEVTR
jgi:sugar phosphate isomerase/epimerase